MGFDIDGRKPTSKAGTNFRNTVWYWHPLWDYCDVVAPRLTRKVKHGHTNDGDGLNAKDASALAAALENELKAGRTKKYATVYMARLAVMPRETCILCRGTGIRTDAIGQSMGQATKKLAPREAAKLGRKVGTCNGCAGVGDKEAWDAGYPFTVKNVRDFAAFLRDCGGFNIN